MNTYERKRKELLAEIKDVLLSRQSTLRAIRLEQGESGKWGIVTKCTLCGRSKRMPACYWRGHDCGCTRVEKIVKTNLCTDKFHTLVKQRHPQTEVLGEFKGMNYKILVRCLVCNTTWTPWAGMFALGHGCRRCAANRIKRDCVAKYGVEYHFQRPEIKRKRQRTMVRLYGKKHALQNKELFDKMQVSSSRRKLYVLGRRKIQVQGYEPQGLDFILSKGVKPKDIEAGVGNPNMPTVDYWYKGMWRVYYPDIWLPRQNRIFEVKNSDNYRRDHKRNMLKEKACIEAGYNFTWLVMSKSGERIDHRNL